MLDIGLEIKGLKQMEANLIDIANEVGAKKATGMLTSALREGSKEYQQDMLNNVTISNFTRIVKNQKGQKVEIRPGFLKSRIKIRASTNSKGTISKKFGKNVVSVINVGVFKVPYIVPYEYGTTRQAPTPIIRNAFQNKSRSAINIINQRLARKIELAQKRIARNKQ